MIHDPDLFLHAFEQQLDARLAMRRAARPFEREKARKAVKTRRHRRYERDALIAARNDGAPGLGR